ncbi:hypothetical protein C8R43DRAFT_1047771 [Mycena crocata]|nr:hypothetical protein C8R43DRAFT_1047771 [Mycena crocata]
MLMTPLTLVVAIMVHHRDRNKENRPILVFPPRRSYILTTPRGYNLLPPRSDNLLRVPPRRVIPGVFNTGMGRRRRRRIRERIFVGVGVDVRGGVRVGVDGIIRVHRTRIWTHRHEHRRPNMAMALPPRLGPIVVVPLARRGYISHCHRILDGNRCRLRHNRHSLHRRLRHTIPRNLRRRCDGIHRHLRPPRRSHSRVDIVRVRLHDVHVAMILNTDDRIAPARGRRRRRGDVVDRRPAGHEVEVRGLVEEWGGYRHGGCIDHGDNSRLGCGCGGRGGLLLPRSKYVHILHRDTHVHILRLIRERAGVAAVQDRRGRDVGVVHRGCGGWLDGHDRFGERMNLLLLWRWHSCSWSVLSLNFSWSSD